MSASHTTYVIDTNILINWSIFTPMEFHTTFWKQLSDCIQSKQIIVIQDVADECKFGLLKGWVTEQTIIPIDDGVRQRAIEINDKYTLITQKSGSTKSEADPVIIAYAEKNHYGVFSYESKKKPFDNVNKIPDVCEDLDISCERWTAKILKEINFKEI